MIQYAFSASEDKKDYYDFLSENVEEALLLIILVHHAWQIMAQKKPQQGKKWRDNAKTEGKKVEVRGVEPLS